MSDGQEIQFLNQEIKILKEEEGYLRSAFLNIRSEEKILQEEEQDLKKLERIIQTLKGKFQKLQHKFMDVMSNRNSNHVQDLLEDLAHEFLNMEKIYHLFNEVYAQFLKAIEMQEKENRRELQLHNILQKETNEIKSLRNMFVNSAVGSVHVDSNTPASEFMSKFREHHHM